MSNSSPRTITQLLLDWGTGNQAALEELVPLVYQELYQRARSLMNRERPDHTLQATALINETYLRLIDCQQVNWKSQNDFYAVCANLMRQILVDSARSRASKKRGGETRQISLDEALVIPRAPSAELVVLDDALNALAALNPRQSKVVELRYFGGLSVEETADALQVSPDTVMRDWKLAKVWLLRELRRDSPNDSNKT
jgi:RNA polymerase sigma factor (TIGR02999 family)